MNIPIYLTYPQLIYIYMCDISSFSTVFVLKLRPQKQLAGTFLSHSKRKPHTSENHRFNMYIL